MYSKKSTMKELVNSEAAKEVFIKHMGPESINNPMLNMVLGMTLEELARIPIAKISQEMLQLLDEDLQKIS